MENSSTRPYMAIFAIVAIVVAGFILKQQFADAATTPGEAEKASPQRMLVKDKGPDRIPEPIPQWFKRVGWQKLGFASEQQMKDTEAMLAAGGRGGPELTKEQMQVIKDLVASKERIPRDIGISAIPNIRKSEDRKAFVPVVKSLFAPGAPNQAVRTILTGWCRSGDMELVRSLEKDPDKDFGKFANRIVTDIEYPGKDG